MRNSNHIKQTLTKMVKETDVHNAINSVGGYDHFKRVMGIDSPSDFMNLFKDLEVVTSVSHPKYTLLRFREKYNVAVIYTPSYKIFVNSVIYDYIFEFKPTIFNFSPETFILLWFIETYKLTGIKEVRFFGSGDFTSWALSIM